MKRFSKILSAVMVICLLCGAIAISVSAATTAENKEMLQIATSNSASYANDFDSGTYSLIASYKSYTDFGTMSASSKSFLMANKEGAAAKSSAYINFASGPDGSAYKDPNGPSKNTNFISGIPSDTVLPGQEGLTGNQLSAITVDFDFGTDKYMWEFGGVTKIGTTPDEGAENIRVALDGIKNSVKLRLVFRVPKVDGTTGDGSGGDTLVQDMSFYYDETTRLFYAYNSSTGKKIALSNKVGVLDHFTMVMYPDASTGYVRINHYVNGEYLSSVSKGSTNHSNYVYYDGFRVVFNNADCSLFSYAIDNFAVNYYNKGASESAGIEAFTNPSNTKKLYEHNDVVYNGDYVQTGCGSISLDQGVTKCSNIALFKKTLDTLKTGDEILIDGATVTDFTPPEDVENFTVKALNGATFTLSAEGNTKYKEISSAGTVKYELATADDKIMLEWLDSDGTVLATTDEIVKGATPIVPEDIIVSGKVDYATGELYTHNGWEWTCDGEIYEPIGELSEYFFLYGVINDGKLQIRPTFSTEQAAFTVADENGDAYVPEGFSTSALLDIKNFSEVFSAAKSGSTLKLFSKDGTNKIKYTSNTLGTISEAGKKLSVDFNGITLYHYVASGGSEHGVLFYVNSDNAELTLFNGSVIDVIIKDSQIYNSPGLVRTPSSVDTATVNFGTKDGTKPFNYYGGTLFRAGYNGTPVASNENKIFCNIYGGMYYSSTRAAWAMFSVSSNDVNITINDAMIVWVPGSSVYGIFGSYQDMPSENQVIECYDTTIISVKADTTTPAPIFCGYGQFRELSAYFEGCTIYASHIATSKNASVVLGPDNVVSKGFGDIFMETVKTEFTIKDGVKYAKPFTAIKEKVSATYTKNIVITLDTTLNPSDINGALYDMTTVNFEIPIALITYDPAAALPEKLTEVIFSKDGTSEDAKGIYIIGDDIAGVTPAVTATKLNNGWFDLGYSGWSQNGSTTVNAGANIFTPTATVPVGNIKAKLNMSLYTYFAMNLYIPEVIDGVTFNGFYSSTDEKITTNLGTATINDMTYSKNTVYPKVFDFSTITRVVKFTVTYDFDGNGTIDASETNVPCSHTFYYSQIDYAEKVADSYKCGSDELKLIYDMIKYKEETTRYAGATVTAAVEADLAAFYAKFDSHTSCTCKSDLENLEFSAEELAITSKSYEALSPYVTGFSFTLANEPTFNVFIATLADGQTATVTVKTTDIEGKEISIVSKGSAAVDDATRYDFEPDKASEIKNVYTITVVISEAGKNDITVTGQYCLAEYIKQNASITAAKAFWAYSNSAYNYRVLTEDEQQ